MTGSASFGAGGVALPRAVDAGGQARADVLVGDDRAVVAEDLVPAGVIAVVVRVEDELDRLGGDAVQRLADLRRERRELVVDDDDAVVADRDADVAAGAGEHVHGAGDLRHLDLDLAEVLLGEERTVAAKTKNERSIRFAHGARIVDEVNGRDHRIGYPWWLRPFLIAASSPSRSGGASTSPRA